jgi:hypothetical protein
LKKVFVVQFLRCLVVEVYEEPKPFGLLLDDVQFYTRIDSLDIPIIKVLNFVIWNVEDTTVHEDVTPRPLWDLPCIYHSLEYTYCL